MEPDQILVKTDKGREEIKSRALALSQAARTLLIASDGQKTVRSLTELFSKIPGVTSMIQELVDLGLIAPQGIGGNGATPREDDRARKLRQATQYLSETASANLGFSAFTFSLKVGRCSSLDDVLALIPEYEAALVKKRGAETAGALTAKLRSIVA
jgi:hypothetical protein